MQTADDALLRDREMLRTRIQESIQQVRRSARRYRRMSTGLLLVGLLCGALSTALAGEAFRGGRLAATIAQTTTGRVPAESGFDTACIEVLVLEAGGGMLIGAGSMLG